MTVRLPGTHHDLLTGTSRTDEITLGRYDVMVLRP